VLLESRLAGPTSVGDGVVDRLGRVIMTRLGSLQLSVGKTEETCAKSVATAFGATANFVQQLRLLEIMWAATMGVLLWRLAQGSHNNEKKVFDMVFQK
jgi:hypothetical protein